MQFTHLHVHSSFTFGEASSNIEELVERAKFLGMTHLALTDKNGLYGAIRFYRKAKKEGIVPILGTEITVEPSYPLVLLAKTEQGYQSLCGLITRMHRSVTNRPFLSADALASFSKDLIALSGGPGGKIYSLLKAGQTKKAERAVEEFIDIFGRENFVIELQDHLLPEEYALNTELIDLASRLRLLVCATNNVHFAEKEGYELHRILVRAARCINRCPVSEKPNGEYYLKSYQLMAPLFTRYPFALLNANLLAGECKLELPLNKIHPPPSPFAGDAHLQLAKLCFEGLPEKYPDSPREAVQRLIKELKLIESRKLSSYFLLVEDIIRFARERGIRSSTRGSAAGSLVSYLLGISGIDPIEHGLLFERFLNSKREDFPDIDLDFDSRRRDEVLSYVFTRYGSNRAALVATVPTHRARGALREAGRAIGLKHSEVTRLTRFFPYLPANRIKEALYSLPELEGSELQQHTALIRAAEKLHSLPRNLSSHLGGVVLTEEDITTVVPLEKSRKGYPLSQYDKNDLEVMGLVKLDLLSLRMLGALGEATEELEKRGLLLTLDTLSLNDDRVYELLSLTKTVGCFQLESPGMRQLLGRLQPKTFADIVANISLFRPGPMQADMIEPFLKRRWGKEKISYLYPSLEPILKETYGVIIFHEQVLEIVRELAGYNLGEADFLRRSLKKGIGEDEKEALKKSFLASCSKNGVPESVAREAFDSITAFGAFGFCKAHAVSFARIAYQSAYLKLYHPREFFLGLVNNQPGLYPVGVLLNEARRWGVSFLGPDINKSQGKSTLEKSCLRIGLLAVRNMGPKQLEILLTERSKRPFCSFYDVLRRVRLGRPCLLALISAGCFDSLEEKREKLFSFFPERLRLAPTSRIALELEALGFSLSDHPLALISNVGNREGCLKSGVLSSCREGQKVTVAGMKILVHTPPTKSGLRVLFLTLEDDGGLIDVVVFPSTQEHFARIIYRASFLCVEGHLKKHGRAVSIVAEKVYDMDEDARRAFGDEGGAGFLCGEDG